MSSQVTNAVQVWGIGLAYAGMSIAGFVYALDVFHGIFTVDSWAYNITGKILEAINNLVAQLPNAGKLMGVMILVAVLGFGGYGMYQGAQYIKSKTGR